MFEQLISLKKPLDKRGIVESVNGHHYLAQQVDFAGNIIGQATHNFKSFSQAKQWLKKQGIHTISLRQSAAYFEIIGLEA
jgi:hypothetical protein